MALVDAVTTAVFTAKFAVVAPAATTKFGETVAPALLLDRTTTVPPGGAPALRVTVPVANSPPTTFVGLRVSEVSLGGGVTVRAAVWIAPEFEAVMVAVVELATTAVVTVKLALVAAAATVTLDGTTAAALLLVRVITAPSPDATPSRVTVPREVQPPVTLVGFRPKEDRLGATLVTVRSAVRFTPE